MTVYEDLEHRKNLLIDAAANCYHHGTTAMGEVWAGKALLLHGKMLALSVEQAEETK